MDREVLIKYSRKHSRKRSNKNKRSLVNSSQNERYAKNYDTGLNISKIVEYSDVSSEDFSAPEAGEIQTEDSDADIFGNKLHSNRMVMSDFSYNKVFSFIFFAISFTSSHLDPKVLCPQKNEMHLQTYLLTSF